MPYGIQRSYEERKAEHLRRFGTLEDFPETPRGRFARASGNSGSGMDSKWIVGGAIGLFILYHLLKKQH